MKSPAQLPIGGRLKIFTFLSSLSSYSREFVSTAPKAPPSGENISNE
jgi:hypothetical protein